MFGKLPNRLFMRLETLARYFEANEFNDDTIQIIENTMKESDGNDGTFHFKFNTKQGPVEIVFFTYFLEQRYYNLSYTTYAGTTLFELIVSKDEIKVFPCMGYSYTVDAKDIDLAILELETFLQQTYGDIDIRWEKYQLEEKLAWQSHNQQLKELL